MFCCCSVTFLFLKNMHELPVNCFKFCQSTHSETDDVISEGFLPATYLKCDRSRKKQQIENIATFNSPRTTHIIGATVFVNKTI